MLGAKYQEKNLIEFYKSLKSSKYFQLKLHIYEFQYLAVSTDVNKTSKD